MYKCQKCNKLFDLSIDEKDRLEYNRKSGAQNFYTECPYCDNDITIELTKVIHSVKLRCPVAQCAGWVDYVESGFESAPFWGCGECGSRWKNQKSLFAEIVSIGKLYPYRKMCYEKISKSNCIPADLSKEIEGYDEKVLDEKEDNRNENSDSYYRD